MSYGLRSVWALGLFFIFLFLFFCEFEIFSTDLQTVEYYFLISLICLEICFLVCILSFKNVAYFFFLVPSNTLHCIYCSWTQESCLILSSVYIWLCSIIYIKVFLVKNWPFYLIFPVPQSVSLTIPPEQCRWDRRRGRSLSKFFPVPFNLYPGSFISNTSFYRVTFGSFGYHPVSFQSCCFCQVSMLLTCTLCLPLALGLYESNPAHYLHPSGFVCCHISCASNVPTLCDDLFICSSTAGHLGFIPVKSNMNKTIAFMFKLDSVEYVFSHKLGKLYGHLCCIVWWHYWRLHNHTSRCLVKYPYIFWPIMNVIFVFLIFLSIFFYTAVFICLLYLSQKY